MAHDEALIGCIGKLSVATRGANGPGEVVVSVRGGSEAFIAWSPEPLPIRDNRAGHRVPRAPGSRRERVD